MQNAQTIYQQTVQPLPDSEKLRLAAIILQDLSKNEPQRQSALDLLQNLPNNSVFTDSHAVEEHLRSERDAWDN